MGLQEGFDLTLDPYGFLCVSGTNDDQKVRILKRAENVVRKIAGNGQFILIPEQPQISLLVFPDSLRNTVMLQCPVNLCSHTNIFRMVTV